VIAALRERGRAGPWEIENALGVRHGSLGNALIYIAEKRPEVAEDDDGKLVWIGGGDEEKER
jgi:hypothetical protein